MIYKYLYKKLTRVKAKKINAISVAISLLSIGVGQSVLAGVINTDNSDVKLRWDNTLKYTAGWRVADPDLQVASGNGMQPNTDWGDLSHGKGLINNRVDLLSELDFSYKRFGFRASAAAWTDSHYNKDSNDYVGPPNTQSALMGGANNLNTSASKELMGQKVELLDAFVYGSVDLGQESQLTVRAGKHTQLYGETLFLGANGIANAQGPVDLVKAYSLPNAQFKEIAIPIGQISTDLQINQNLSVGMYYQYDWKSMRLPAAGSYFSMADFIGAGADTILLPPQMGGGAAFRTADLNGSDSGNFGARVKFKVGNIDYGFYAARYSDKAPIPVLDIINKTYSVMHATKIDTYGASFSTVLGETNVGGEMSVRKNTPLATVGDLILSTLPNADNEINTPYARGNSFHFNLSAISVFPGNKLWDGASFVGEFAFNRLLSVTHNPVNAIGISGLNTTHTRDASAFRVVFTPEYFQVIPGVDLQVPIGLGYGLNGRSAIFQVAPEGGGDLSIGVVADINKTWKAALNYTNYFGTKGPAPSLDPTQVGAGYKQYYADRDFVTFTIQRTF